MNTAELRLVGALAAIGLSVGCGAGGAASEGSEDPSLESSFITDANDSTATDAASLEPAAEATRPATTLNSFEVGESRVEFQEVFDGSIALAEPTSAFRRGSLSQRLAAEVGKLTMLEKFYALAPEGEVPHERLVASHPVEAAALGRADETIQRVDFDTQQPIEKSIAACDAAFEVNGQTFTLRLGLFNRSGNASMCLGPAFNCSHLITNATKVFQWCNDTSSTLSPTVDFGNSSVWFGSTTFGAIAAGQKFHWESGPTASPTRYRMKGASTSSPYHMEAGKAP